MTRAKFLAFFGVAASGQAVYRSSEKILPPLPPQNMKSCYYPPDSVGNYWTCVHPDGTYTVELDPNRMATGLSDGRAKLIIPDATIPPRKPPNGQCPSCGTQAPPWKPEHLQAYFTIDGHHVIMCAHCRCVFGQDAEGEK
jgi:hypothetical protein